MIVDICLQDFIKSSDKILTIEQALLKWFTHSENVDVFS